MRSVMRTLLASLAIGLVVVAAAPAQGPAATQEYPGLETGKMWTFDAPPLEYWAQRYNFRPSQAWLDHTRLSSVRIPGCTASFVSADGLIMSNHHCARGCVQQVTRQGEDLLSNGFVAATQADERACQGFTVDQLAEITDVTPQVNGAVPVGASADRAAALRDSATNAITERCVATAANTHCEVITMYRGGQYKLYRFRRWTETKLVFVPETQAASFGGDPDNFTFPRHDLDMSLLRVYQNGQPVRPEHFYRWSANGSREGDLLFVVGNPGSTNRLQTVAQLEFMRDAQIPSILFQINSQVDILLQMARENPERAAALRNNIFYLQNSQKVYLGQMSGLSDSRLLDQKRAWEREFRSRVAANPELRRLYGAAWDNIGRIKREQTTLDARRRFYSFNALGSRLMSYGGQLTRLPVESAKPDTARLPAYRDENRANLDRNINSPAPIDTTFEIRLLTAWFTEMARALPANDPVRRQALGTRTPEAAARAMVAANQLGTAALRQAIRQGGGSAVATSTDPFIQLARVIDPLSRPILTRITALANVESQNDELVARALLAVFGNSVAPDATFSLRISDGEVKRYPSNGTFAPAYTTFAGLYDRSWSFSGESPWDLTPRWVAARERLNLQTPFNFASTNDITGGNSGSPIINRDGEIVGLIFDGNIESLPLDFLFRESVGRSISVDSRGIVEALRRVYEAGALADELTQGRRP